MWIALEKSKFIFEVNYEYHFQLMTIAGYACTGFKMSMNSILSMSFPKLPNLSSSDFTDIRTADVSRTLLFLGSGPLFARGPRLEQMYVENYGANRDHTEWSFRFGSNHRFSNGSSLTAKNWYDSLARAIRRGTGVHFNPKRDIVGAANSNDGYCEGLQLVANCVNIRLHTPNHSFYKLAGSTEATILPIDDTFRDEVSVTRLPSSGPYFLKESAPDRVLLEINANYPGHVGRAKYKFLELVQLTDTQALEARLRGKLDFFFPASRVSRDDIKKLSRNSQVVLDTGYSYFISIRDQQASKIGNPWADNFQFRKCLAELLKEAPETEELERHSTLLTGNGLGRLDDNNRNSIENINIKELPKLRIAVVRSAEGIHLIEYLMSYGLDIEVVWVDNFNNLYEGAAAYCDMFLCGNDYHDYDPFMSLYNSFNPDRPLFFGNDHLRDELLASQNERDEDRRSILYAKLIREILGSYYVLPIYKKWFYYYADPKINLKGFIPPAVWTLTTQ